jgi:endonuclease III
MNRYQNKIPPNHRYSLHVNMIALGREICTSKNPECKICPLIDFCKDKGRRDKRSK